MMDMECVDFGRARLCWQLAEITRQASFSVEAVAKCGEELWVVGSTVMAGNVYEPTMPKFPPYSFTFAASVDRCIRFRDRQGGSLRCQDDVTQWASIFSRVWWHLPHACAQHVARVDLPDALNTYGSLVATLSLAAPQSELHFPVKHCNVHHDGHRWQIETGPILLPVPGEIPYALAYVFLRQDGACSALVRGDGGYCQPLENIGTLRLHRIIS